MKRSMALLIAATLLAAPASASVVDLSVITCKEFLDSGKESIGYIMMWLDGYYTGEDDPPVVDFDKMKQRGEKKRRLSIASAPLLVPKISGSTHML